LGLVVCARGGSLLGDECRVQLAHRAPCDGCAAESDGCARHIAPQQEQWEWQRGSDLDACSTKCPDHLRVRVKSSRCEDKRLASRQSCQREASNWAVDRGVRARNLPGDVVPLTMKQPLSGSYSSVPPPGGRRVPQPANSVLLTDTPVPAPACLAYTAMFSTCGGAGPCTAWRRVKGSGRTHTEVAVRKMSCGGGGAPAGAPSTAGAIAACARSRSMTAAS